MSRPLAWNGYQWVDPSFWTGSEFKSYIPAVYDVPGRNGFDAGPEGWVDSTDNPAAWGGGVISRRINAQPWVHGPTPSGWYGQIPDQNRKVGFRCSFALTVHSGTSEYLNFTFGSFGLGGHEEGFQTGPVSRGWGEYQTSAFANLGIEPGWWGGLDLFIGVESANYTMDQIDMTLEVDWVQLVYEDGSPVYFLGNPGWEPKVKRADGTWK